MQEAIVRPMRPSPVPRLEDYDFLRATYQALLRARETDPAALDAAFEALDAAHERLRAAHRTHQAEPALH